MKWAAPDNLVVMQSPIQNREVDVVSFDDLEPYSDSELVFGLVAPIGADLSHFQAVLVDALKHYEYEANPVRLSALALALTGEANPSAEEGEFVRIHRKMDAGNAVREKNVRGLVFAAASQISRTRKVENDRVLPLGRVVHILNSLKHPEEVLALRRIYGAGFYLLGVVTSEREREAHLIARRGCSRDEVKLLRERDDHEDVVHGQRTRDTFHLADAFIALNDTAELHRFLDLIFGAPHVTPTRDEHSMFMAFSAALRSGDLSRQVGAVIVSAEGEVVATGANDVPAAGGGLIWPGPNDARDFQLGKDFNQAERDEIIGEILTRLRPDNWAEGEWQKRGSSLLRGASIMDITEYGRPVHAEMDALLAAGRAGVSARGATVYCTTFPCHNCAKHLIAAGICRVVYVEPYPKSRTGQLYKHAVRFWPDGEPADAVLFESFRGIGPRRFFDLFSMNLGSGYSVKRKTADGLARADWWPCERRSTDSSSAVELHAAGSLGFGCDREALQEE